MPLNAAQEYVLRKVYALEDDTVRLLFAEYRTAYDRMKAALEATWSTRVQGDSWSSEDATFRRRTEALVAQLAEEMQALLNASANIGLDAAEDAYRAGAVGQGYALEQIGADITLPLLPSEAIRAQVLAPYQGSTFVDRFADSRLDFERAIRTSLVQSQIEGEGIYKAQRRIADALGIKLGDARSPGTKAHRQNFFRTQNIARTEILRASNLGAVAIYRANDDVLSGYDIIAARDDLVCPICAPLDGRQVDLDGNPTDGKGPMPSALPPFHPQCRCNSIPRLIDELLQQRISPRRETFEEWAQRKGITQNLYGRAFDLRGKQAPQTGKAA